MFLCTDCFTKKKVCHVFFGKDIWIYHDFTKENKRHHFYFGKESTVSIVTVFCRAFLKRGQGQSSGSHIPKDNVFVTWNGESFKSPKLQKWNFISCSYPPGSHDHISHLTGKGKSSTQKYRLVGDMLGVAPSQDASDHQNYYMFNRESL